MKKSYLRKSQNPERPAYFRFSEFAAANALQGQTGAPPAMSRKKCAPKTCRKIPANLAILRRPSLSRLRAAYFRAMPRLRKICQKKRLTGGAPYKKLETKFQITRNAGVSRRAQT